MVRRPRQRIVPWTTGSGGICTGSANLVVGITALYQRSAALSVLTGIIALIVVLIVSALRHIVSRR